MSKEIYWLTLTAMMTAVLWVPYVLNRMVELGLLGALSPHAKTKPKAAWAERMMKAHTNGVENLVLFATLVLALQVTGSQTSLTATAATVYFFARLVHFLAFTLAVPYLRTVSFLVGFACQMIVGLTILGVL